jgi:hypothetical protein
VRGVFKSVDGTRITIPDPTDMTDFQMRRILWKIGVLIGEADPNDPSQLLKD